MPKSSHPSKFTLKADRIMLKEVSKNPKMSSWNLQQALATTDVKVHASTVRKRLHKFNLHGDVRGGNLCSLREGQTEVCQRECWQSQDFWMFFGQMSLKLHYWHQNRQYVWRKPKTAYQGKEPHTALKYGGGSVMVCSRFASSTMTLCVYQSLLEEHVRPSVKKLKLNWTIQHKNGPKHTVPVNQPRTGHKLKKRRVKA